MIRFKTFLPIVLLLAILLSACRAGFPTDKFVRSEQGVNRHLQFLNGGRWEGYYDGNLLTFGSYRVDGDQITIESDFLCEESGGPVQAIYTWSYSGDTLTLQPVGEDGCAERVELLSGGPYRKSQ